MENNIGYDGEPYTKIPNQILKALLQIKLQNYEIRVLLAIARKTYGFNKNRDLIKQRQLVTLTGISESHINRTVKSLVKKHILIKNNKVLEIQRDFKLWDIPEKIDLKNLPAEASFSNLEEDKNLPDEVIKLTSRGKKNLPDEAYTKNIIKKTNKEYNIYSRDDPVTDFFNEEKNKIIKNQIEEIINYLNTKADKNFRASSRSTIKNIAARLKDGYSLEDFKKVINIKTHKWKNTDYDTYLRPETLFGTKFESYLNEKIIGGNNVKFIKHFENERVHNDEDRAKIVRNFYGE